jgi:hypothetical protein
MFSDPSIIGGLCGIAPLSRRIYTAHDTFLDIYDMDSFQKITTLSPPYGERFFDELNQKLYVWSADKIYKYSLINDILNKEQERLDLTEISFKGTSFDGSDAFLYCNNSGTYGLYRINTSNFNNLTPFNVNFEDLVSRFSYSKDGAKLFTVSYKTDNSYEGYFYILDSSDYSLINKINIPGTNYNTVFTLTNDDSILAVTCRSTYGYENTYIGFIYNVTNASSLRLRKKTSLRTTKDQLFLLKKAQLQYIPLKMQ